MNKRPDKYKTVENGNRKCNSYRCPNGHSNETCYQQQSASANLDRKKRWCTYDNSLVLAIQMPNVFIKEAVNLLSMVNVVGNQKQSLLIGPQLAAIQNFAVTYFSSFFNLTYS